MFTKAIATQACVDYTVLSELCVDEIKQCIIQAYIQLVFQAVDTDNSRPVVVRLGPLEVRLSETPPKYAAFGLPPFWIEVFDGTSQDSIDSIGCHELDAAGLAAAVEMIVSAAGSQSSDDPADPLTSDLDPAPIRRPTSQETAVERNNEQGSFWASATAVLALTVVVGILYLPLLL